MSAITQRAAWQYDPAKVKRIALVCGALVVVVEHADPRNHEARATSAALAPDVTLADLARMAFAEGCHAVYLVPSASREDEHPLLRAWDRLATEAMRADPEHAWHEISADHTVGGMVAQQRDPNGEGRGLPLCIYYLARLPWGMKNKIAALASDPLARCVAIGRALALASHTLGARLVFTPGNTGTQLLRAHLAKADQRWDLAPLSSAWRERLHWPTQIQWMRPDVGEAIQGAPLVLHKHDRNWSYVSSAREVPIGEPHETASYEPGCIGTYEISASAPAGWLPTMPGLFHVGEGMGTYPHRVDHVWAWEPQIRLALRLGWEVEIHQGIAWRKDQKKDLLRGWQEDLWAARRACANYADPTIGGLAESIVKAVGVTSIGRLKHAEGRKVVSASQAASEGLDIEWRVRTTSRTAEPLYEVKTNLARADLYRPEWWACIISNAVERLQSAALTSAPRDCWLLYVDEMYCGEQHAEIFTDPRKAGGWKDGGSISITSASGIDPTSPYALKLALNEMGGGDDGEDLH